MPALLERYTHLWDRLGICASLLCLVHCLALPVLLITGGTLWAAWDMIHVWMAVLLVPVVVLASLEGFRTHGRRRVMAALGIGLVIVVAAVLLESWMGKGPAAAVSVLGGLILIAGHWRNLTLGTQAQCAQEQAS